MVTVISEWHGRYTLAHGNLGPQLQRCQCKAPYAVPTKSLQERTLALRTTPDDNGKRDCRTENHSQVLEIHHVPDFPWDGARDLVGVQPSVQKRNIAQGSLSQSAKCPYF